MMDVTVKTLDGQNRSFCVPENITVKQFKEKIANSISIAADTQRLIFHGRVLHDEKLLKDYDVHGKVLHVVLRPPPSTRPQSSSTETSSSQSSPAGSNIYDMVQEALGGMGEIGRNARVTTRTSPDGSSVDVHIHLVRGRQESEAQLRLNQARRMITMANETLTLLENPQSSDGSSTTTTTTSATTTTTESQAPGQSSPVAMETNGSSPSTSSSPSGDGDAEVKTESRPANGSEGASSSSQSESSSTGGATANQTGSPGTGASATQQGPVRPNVSALADVLEEVQALNRRLQPHMDRFQQVVRTDAQMNQTEQQSSQRTCNMVADVMHCISHSYHCLSDLMVDTSQEPPRQLYATVVQHPIPVQAQFSVGGSPQLHRRTVVRRTHNSNPSSRSSSAQRTQTPVTPTSSQATQAMPTTASSGTQANQLPAGTSAQATPSTQAPPIPQRQPINPQQGAPGGPIHMSLNQGDNPYLFVEVGPETVTVNSISSRVVSSSETTGASNAHPPSGPAPPGSAPAGPTPASPAPAGAGGIGPTPPTSTSTTTSGQQPPHPSTTQAQGANILPPNLIDGIVQSILRSTGHGEAPAFVQITGLQGTAPRGPFGSMPMFFGPQGVRPPTAPTTNVNINESATQTHTAGGMQNPANSGTQTIPGIPTSSSGTQTQTGENANRQTQTGATLPPRPVGAEVLLPGLFGIPGLGPQAGPMGFNSLDPFLPCSSRHFLTRQTRMFTPQMPGGLAATTASSTQPSNTNQNSTTAHPAGSRPHTRPATTTTSSATGAAPRPSAPPLNPMTMPLFQPGGLAFLSGLRMGPPPSAGPQPSVPPGGAQPRGGSAPHAEPDFIQALRTMLQTAQQQPGQSVSTSMSSTNSTNSTSSTTTTTTTTDQNQNVQSTPQPMTDEAFTQLVQGIHGFMVQSMRGQAPQQSIMEFLNGFVGDSYNMTIGEGFINDIMNCVMSNLQITDLIQVFCGIPTSLERVHQPLQTFLRERVLQNDTATRDNIERGIERTLETSVEDLIGRVDDMEVVGDIDLLATLHHFLVSQFTDIMFYIMNTSVGDASFPGTFYQRIRHSVAECIILASSCLRGGLSDLRRLVGNRVRQHTQGVNPLIQEWMVNMIDRHIEQFVPQITVTEDDVTHYLKHRSSQSAQAAASRPVSAPVKKPESTFMTPQPSEPAQPMETSPTSSPGAAEPKIETVHKKPVSLQNRDPTAPEPSRAPVPMGGSPSGAQGVNGAQSPCQAGPDVNGAQSPCQAGPDDWKTVVPEDWIPVIERDIETQRTQKPQKPHSDTYLQGLPPKRRRLMTEERPGDLSNPAEVLPETIRRAVAAAAVEPISSIENLTSEVSDNVELQTAFQDQVRNVMIQRLDTDSDYRREQFPNTDDFFHKNADKK